MTRPGGTAFAIAALALLASACGLLDTSVGTAGATGPGTAVTPPSQGRVVVHAVAIDAGDPYLGLARTLTRDGVAVWFEADLVKAWQAGPTALAAAVGRLGGLARRTPIVGFKVADELGYQDGITSPEQAMACLRAIHDALRQVAPHAEVLIDMVVPPLGCLPWRGAEEEHCALEQRARYPAASEAAVSTYLQSGLVDRLDLSTGLLDPATYLGWHTTPVEAQRDAWNHAEATWGTRTTLQARKALAAPGGYRGNAAEDLATYVDTPLAAGARAVDVWTWRQGYRGATVSLLGPGLSPNALWTGLEARRAGGAHLFTHMTPSLLPRDTAARDHECRMAARAFDAVFVAAGTG